MIYASISDVVHRKMSMKNVLRESGQLRKFSEQTDPQPNIQQKTFSVLEGK